MKLLYNNALCILFVIALASCNRQSKTSNQIPTNSSVTKNKIVGGGCDGCELMFVSMPVNITSVDTSAGWNENGQKLLVTGSVFKIDGTTAAPNVIIYYWQTDKNGYYSPEQGMDKKAERHGHIRGWVKTDETGNYSIYTSRPAPYPNENIPVHIHISIKEPNIDNEYYIDDFVFEDDKLLTAVKRKTLENRGGSGILSISQSGNLQIAKHNIILGLNIPNYPDTIKSE